MRTRLRVCVVALAAVATSVATAQAQSGPPAGDPPARVGRLAYLQGTVSFHDAEQDTWSPAAVNTPITTGDALWTEPNGHDEITVAGTRVRMDGGTQLDVLALDDSQTRLQLDQGRLDVRTFAFDKRAPYQIVTPRGTVSLLEQGDYYIHSGSVDDPTVLGVRAGAAQIETPNGQVLAVRPGEEGEAIGDSNALELRTVRSAPPALPPYWAERDRAVSYEPPQYVTADVTGYEDLAAYGSWTPDPTYGQVWYPRSVPAGWEPYRTGSWSYVQPWGWTWVDAQPWGFAPYHYGRWAHRDDRWFWVPPQRAERPVYAPALVAFLGGVELGAALGEQNRAPVGWFPLGPREPYVPPYTADRNYYRRVNASARVEQAILDERWQRAERHEALRNEQLANRSFATVVPAEDFVRSRPVSQVALKIAPDKLRAATIAPVAAPPAPGRPAAAGAPGRESNAPPINLPLAQTRLANMETLARPSRVERPAAPGPKIVVARPAGANGKPALPSLAPRTASAPPQTPAHGAATPASPAATPRAEEPRPNASSRGPAPQQAEPPRPAETPHAAAPRQEPQSPAARPSATQSPAPHSPAQAHGAAPPLHEAEPAHPGAPAEPRRQTEAPAVQAPRVEPKAAAEPREPATPPRQMPTPAAPPQQAHVPAPPQAVHPMAPPAAAQPHAAPQPHPAAPPQQAQAPAAHPAPAPQQAPHPAPQGEHEEKK